MQRLVLNAVTLPGSHMPMHSDVREHLFMALRHSLTFCTEWECSLSVSQTSSYVHCACQAHKNSRAALNLEENDYLLHKVPAHDALLRVSALRLVSEAVEAPSSMFISGKTASNC